LNKKLDECEQVMKQKAHQEFEQKALERKNFLKKKYKNEIDEL
jgi:Zn/Cd-binding protein ZinT